MGFEAVKEMATCYFLECFDTGNNKHLRYGFDDVHFDHSQAAEKLKECKHPKSNDLSALSYVFGAGTWTREALVSFSDWLASEDNHWHDAFVLGYGSLLYCQESEIPESLHKVMRERIESQKVMAHLLPETESYAMVLESCLQSLAVNSRDSAHNRAATNLRSKCECLREGRPVGGADPPLHVRPWQSQTCNGLTLAPKTAGQ